MTCSLQQCTKCKFDFCWMCLGDWKAHGSEYYECSRYKENPNIANESVHAQAREALKKYLFYFERVCLAGLLEYMLLIYQRMRPVAEFCWFTSPTNIHTQRIMNKSNMNSFIIQLNLGINILKQETIKLMIPKIGPYKFL